MNRSELLSGLRAEYQQWQTLLDQIGPEHMNQPGAAGPWSIKDIVAHLTGWRRRALGRFEAVVHAEPEPPPPWPANLDTDDEINAWIYESNRSRSVREVLDDSDQVFQRLLAAIEGLPAESLADPARYFPWWGGQTISAGAFFGHFHEEHEPDMRAWLARVEEH